MQVSVLRVTPRVPELDTSQRGARFGHHCWSRCHMVVWAAISRAFGVRFAFTRAVRGVTCHLDGDSPVSLTRTRPLHLPPLVHATLCSRETQTSRGAVHASLTGVLTGSLPVIAWGVSPFRRAQISDAQAGVTVSAGCLLALSHWAFVNYSLIKK